MKEDLFCGVGDKVEIISELETSPWPGEARSKRIEKGAIYRVVDIIGYGYDLTLIKGNGPKSLRILNSNMASCAKIIET